MKPNNRKLPKWTKSIEKATYHKVAFNTKLLSMKNSLEEVEKLLDIAIPKKHH